MFRSLFFSSPPLSPQRNDSCSAAWTKRVKASLSPSNCGLTLVRFATLAVLTLALSSPGQCGGWVVTFEVTGKSKADTPENQFYTSYGSNRTRAWDGAGGRGMTLDGTTTFNEGVRGEIVSHDIRHLDPDQYPSTSSTVECGGSITPVFTWVTKANPQDDPPPSVIRFLEKGSVSASRGVKSPGFDPFPIYSYGASLGMKNPVTVSDADGITIRGEARSIILNPKRATQVKGETRSLSANGTAGTPSDKYLGKAHSCGISYSIKFGAITGEARLKFYKQYGQNPELVDLDPNPLYGAAANPTVGDRVWVGVEFAPGSGAHLDPQLQTISMRIKEEEDPKLGQDQHTEEDNHVDVSLPLKPGGGDAQSYKWQKRIGSLSNYNNNNPWQDTTEPFSTSSTDPNGVEYRVIWAWDSQKIQKIGGGKLWDHNGAHTVSVVKVNGQPVESAAGQKIEFLPDENVDCYSRVIAKVAQRKCNVQNLVIKDVSTNVNEDYFIFDPNSDNSAHRQPKFTFKIKDEGDTHKYRWWIYIEPTTQTEPVQSWAFMSGTTQGAQTVTTTWNGKAVDGTTNQEELVPGTYTFDILVEEVNNVENLIEPLLDEIWLKSDYLQIFEHYLQINDNIEEDRMAEVGVKLSAQKGRAASSASVDLLDFDFNLVKSAGLPTAVGVEHGPINIHQLSESEDGSGWRAVFAAVDANAARYRDHENKRAWAVNQGVAGRVIYLIDANTPGTANINQGYIEGAFRNVTTRRSHAGVTVVPWRTPLDANHRPTANQVRSMTQQRYNRAAVVWEGDLSANSVWPGLTLMPPNGHLATPRITQISESSIGRRPGFQGVDAEDRVAQRWAVNNVALHELGHALGLNDNPHHHEDVVNPFCVMHDTLVDRFGEQLANNLNPTHFGGRPRTNHARPHWNAMRAFVGLNPLQ